MMINRIKWLLILSILCLELSGQWGLWAEETPGEPEGEFIYDAHGKRDPFWPLVDSTGAIVTYNQDFLVTDLILEGIMTAAGGKDIAIINGQIVKTGDVVGVYTVKEISSTAVVLQKGLEIFTLQIKKEE
jgi:hypothetical protein